MKIYYKSKIAKLFTFIDGYKTIMLFGAVFTERDSISLRAEYHEEADAARKEPAVMVLC